MMKTTKTLLAALAIALVFGACNKEDTNKQNLMATNEPDPSSLVLGFKQKMEDHKNGIYLKSDEKIQIDSAIWYIDATLNYTYANGNHSFARLHWDTLFIEMDILNSYQAMYQHVFDGYYASLYGVSDKYHAISEENKQFMMAMVEDMGPLPGNKRNLRIITVTGTGTLNHSGDFTQDEAYLWNRNATTDCSYEPANGAPIIFEAMLSTHFNPPPSNPKCRWYFYGSTTTVTHSYEDHQLNATPVNYLDYKIYAASSAIGDGLTDEVKCLEWNQNNSGIHEMQFYYDHLKVFVNEWLGSSQNTGNKKLAPSFIDSWSHTFVPGYETIIYHEPHLKFRKRGSYCQITEPLPER
jgi:hypothetical protein